MAHTETKAAFARRLGVTRPYIAKLADRGMPVTAEGRVPIQAALRHLRDHGTLPRAAEGRPGVNPDADLERALAEDVERMFGSNAND
jgi:hypothetical protein